MEEEKQLLSRRLMRSQTDKMIFGVCSGISEYYNVEVVWVRLVFIFISVTSAFVLGPILYLAMAVLMPSEKIQKNKGEGDKGGKVMQEIVDGKNIVQRRNVLGIIFVTIGLIAFFNVLFPQFWLGWKVIWPIVIIIIGLSFLSAPVSKK